MRSARIGVAMPWREILGILLIAAILAADRVAAWAALIAWVLLHR
jgi:hypothetical protein